MKRNIFLIFIFSMLLLTGFLLENANAYTLIYSEDFSSDPSWITNNASNFYWDSADQNYFIEQVNVNGGGYYSYYDVGNDGYTGGSSFRLEWDIYMDSTDYASGVSFGVYDTDLYAHDNGNFVRITFLKEDRGRIVYLNVWDSNGHISEDSAPSQLSLNKWYKVILEYDNSLGSVIANIKERDTGTHYSTLTLDVGTFPSDMDRIGSSNLRDSNFQVNGASSVAKIDNVAFYTFEVEKEVSIDIKPGSCPNPLNIKSKGVLPVAILGTEDSDVTTIDPASIRLEGIAPLRSSIEDVATQFFVSVGCGCNVTSTDGYEDLTLKFDTQEIVEALGNVEDGDNIVLILTGVTYDGTEIFGEDCIVIKKKGK